MERRQFIRGLCSGVAAWPLAAYAQQIDQPRRIGVLGADATVWKPWMAAFIARLRDLGWIVGENIAIEYRWAEGMSRRVSEIAAEFLRQDIDVIVTYGTAVPILKQATTTIPIVFAVAFDPVRDGLVQSLAHPGGNVTGMSIQQLDLVGKRLELLREAIPQLHPTSHPRRRGLRRADAGSRTGQIHRSSTRAGSGPPGNLGIARHYARP